MPDSMAVTSADIHVRGLGGDIAVECPFGAVDLEDLLAAGPWRTLRWYKGQKHFSGSFMSVTEGALVIYESLLELACLLEADFDWSVSRTIAQPFLRTVRIDGTERKHIPDFLLMTTSGPLVVDVKPAKRLSRPEVAFTFAWSRQVIESRGWEHVVRSEPDSASPDASCSPRSAAPHRACVRVPHRRPRGVPRDGLDLPGHDADGIDIQRLHDLVRGRHSPTRAAAATLGVSIEAVRLALEEHPAPAQPLTPSQARALG